ncbi:taurine ABC transporter ATPase [Kocuria soli]|uniref:Taurine ABC transporter ATPase n=1 Tax=Kocuria soli TaxID=2485125 RepID=A0A3N3ZSE6_9MICC|nr:phosphatase [Kocuria soli]ROZ63530.1 taurine ABC transporter ATPase [Kocuria soli]
MSSPHLTAPTRTELLVHLDATRITGQVATPREANLRNIHDFLAGSEHQYMGIPAGPEDTWDSVFELMVDKVGISPDRSHEQGQDTISAELCVTALERYADVFGRVVRERGRILFATAHPAAMPAVYAPMAQATREAGAQVLTIDGGIPWDTGDVRAVGDVVMVEQYGGLRHTHRPEPMDLVLDQLEAAHRADPSAPLPDLVVTDHGMAGAAGTRGYSVVAVGDCNDPAVFVGEARGVIDVVVPLDDNVPPNAYAPMTAYLLARAGL